MISELDRFRGCLLGVAIGDALGTPYEMKSRSEILKMTNGKGILGFDPNISRKRDDDLELLTSDDFGLTEIIGWSLIRRKCFDIVDIALAHVETLEKNGTLGWGSTTRNGVLELKEYFDSRGMKGRSPFETPKHIERKGCGNGIAMKIAPISLIYRNWSKLFEYCISVGKLTHSDPKSWTAAFAISKLLKAPEDWNNKDILEWLQVECINFEIWVENHFGKFSEYLNPLICDNNRLLYAPIEELAEKIGTSSLSTESVVFSIAVYLRNKTDFRKGVLEAVNAGGDSDSIASIVGSLIGYNVGIEGIPEEWVEYSPEFKNAIILADELYASFR